MRGSQSQCPRRVGGDGGGGGGGGGVVQSGRRGSRWSDWSVRSVHSDSTAQEFPVPWPQNGVISPSILSTPENVVQFILDQFVIVIIFSYYY